MAKLTDLGGRPHSGTVQTAVVGIVVDNVDPDELGRIQVKFPTVHSEPMSFWLRQASPNGGKERGLYALPEKDDEVLVLFMQGSQDVGVIVGQFWNGIDIPPQECKDAMPGTGKLWTAGKKSKDDFEEGSSDLAKNDRRFWKSRSGHLFVFDDTAGAETIQVWDRSHTLALVFDTKNQRIILSNSGGDTHVRTAKNLYLEAGQDIIWHAQQNIDGESEMDTLHLARMNWTSESKLDTTHKAMNYSVEATMTYKAKAGMSASVEGSMSFTGKGGMTATVEGGASTTIKGGVVMIN